MRNTEAGNTHKGFDHVERALAAAERNGLGDTDATMTAVHNVASSLAGFGEIKEACAREKDLVARLQSTGRSIITAMSVLYWTCLLRAGQPDEALSRYDSGVRVAIRTRRQARDTRARDPTKSADVAEASLVLAQIERALADDAGTRSAARDAAVAPEPPPPQAARI